MPTHHTGPPREVLALDSFIKLMRAADSVNAHLSRFIEEAGLTQGQFAVLETLLHLGPMRQCDIGAKLLRSGANMTTVLDNLEQQALVRRTRRPDDRRAVEVSLTPAGRKLITAVFPAHARRITTLFGALPARDQRHLGALCKQLGRSVSGRRPRASHEGES